MHTPSLRMSGRERGSVARETAPGSAVPAGFEGETGVDIILSPHASCNGSRPSSLPSSGNRNQPRPPGATVREFARRGARIALLAREPARLEAARREAEELGAAEAIAIPTDVAGNGQVEAAAARVEKKFGGIDIWINNAMASVFSPIAQM